MAEFGWANSDDDLSDGETTLIDNSWIALGLSEVDTPPDHQPKENLTAEKNVNLNCILWWWSERVRERDVMMWLTTDVWPVRCT